jgi:hypothetical protein
VDDDQDQSWDPIPTVLDGDENGFCGGCGDTVDTLVQHALPAFADLIELLDQDGWTDSAINHADTLGGHLLHLTEHISSGMTPIAWIHTRSHYSLSIEPAPGAWTARAITEWIEIARRDGVTGLLHSRLPWYVPILVRSLGDNGILQTTEVDLRLNRADILAEALAEHDVLNEADFRALIGSTPDDAARATGDLADLLFGVSDTNRANGTVDPDLWTAATTPSTNPDDALNVDPSQAAPDTVPILRHPRSYAYDWAAATSVVWLTILAVAALSDTDTPLIIGEPTYGDTDPADTPTRPRLVIPWPRPDSTDTLLISPDPDDYTQVDSPTIVPPPVILDPVEAAWRRPHQEAHTEPLGFMSTDDPPPFLAVEDDDSDREVLRSIVVPVPRDHGFVCIAVTAMTDTLPTEPFGYDLLPIDARVPSVLAPTSIDHDTTTEPDTLNHLVTGLTRLTDYGRSQDFNEDLGLDQGWALGTLIFARAILDAAQQELDPLIQETLPDAAAFDFWLTNTGTISWAALAAHDDVTAIRFTGTDLTRSNVVYPGLDRVITAIRLAVDSAQYALARVVPDDDTIDSLTATWLSRITPGFAPGEPWRLLLNNDGAWAARPELIPLQIRAH